MGIPEEISRDQEGGNGTGRILVLTGTPEPGKRQRQLPLQGSPGGIWVHWASKEETFRRLLCRSKLDREANMELVEVIWEQFQDLGAYEANVIDTNGLLAGGNGFPNRFIANEPERDNWDN